MLEKVGLAPGALYQDRLFYYVISFYINHGRNGRKKGDTGTCYIYTKDFDVVDRTWDFFSHLLMSPR